MSPWAALAAALALAGCARQTVALPTAPVAAGSAIRVVAEPVGEYEAGQPNPCADPATCGRWRFVAGWKLTSPDTSRLHGLSDLDMPADGRFTAVSDEGDLVRGRITSAGLADVSLTALTDIDGRSVSGRKDVGDSEGLARWPNGDLMVSFEARNDILLYPAGGGPPRKVPRPQSDFPSNEGMEALALDPAGGSDAYLVGREDTRQTWTCRLSGGCAAKFVVPQHGAGKLVSARPMPGGGWVFLLRDFTPLAGNTIWIVITDAAGREIDAHEIKRPMTVDNFEGVAPAPQNDGKVRLYLISDDNFQSIQRTLLVAVDWTPPKGGTR